MGKLTEKQKRFCDEYLVDLNATQAAIRAGYSPKTARKTASENLTKPDIQKYIQKRIADRSARTEITQDFVLKELIAIASVNATDYVQVIEKNATADIEGTVIQLFDDKGNPVMYKTVEPVLTEELTETQKKALEIVKRGRDGFEIRPYSKLKVLELLGKHLGMWDNKSVADTEEQQARIEKIRAETARIKGESTDDENADDGFIEALQGEVAEVWEE